MLALQYWNKNHPDNSVVWLTTYNYPQIEGAFVQGLGLYTMEELKYSPEGVLYTRGPDQYKIPAVCDIPEQFSVSLLSSSQNPNAIYSSKVSIRIYE